MQNISLTKANIIPQLQQILEMAQQAGATDAEVDIRIETGYAATARLGEAETLEYNHDKNITIVVYQDKKTASITTSDMRADALGDAVATALRIARHAEIDPYVGIAEAEYLSNQIPSLALDFPWELSAQAAMQLATECDQLGLAFDKRICNSEGTTVNNHQILQAYGNTNGFSNAYQATRHSISSVLVAQGKDNMQRDYYYYTARDASDLPSSEYIAHTAARRTIDRLNPQAVKTQQGSVLFAPESARSLLKYFIEAISGSALYQQSSFLLDRLEECIFPTWFSLAESPHLVKGLGSAPFDDNGLLTYDKYFVENGRLKNYALNIYAARKLEMQPTANAGSVHNLIVAPGKENFAQLLAHLGTGLLAIEVSGQGANIVNGDYSQGVSGFWVENGEIAYAVDEATVAGNLNTMFKNISAVGNDIDQRSNIHTPSILIDGMMIAGRVK